MDYGDATRGARIDLDVVKKELEFAEKDRRRKKNGPIETPPQKRSRVFYQKQELNDIDNFTPQQRIFARHYRQRKNSGIQESPTNRKARLNEEARLLEQEDKEHELATDILANDTKEEDENKARNELQQNYNKDKKKEQEISIDQLMFTNKAYLDKTYNYNVVVRDEDKKLLRQANQVTCRRAVCIDKDRKDKIDMKTFRNSNKIFHPDKAKHEKRVENFGKIPSTVDDDRWALERFYTTCYSLGPQILDQHQTCEGAFSEVELVKINKAKGISPETQTAPQTPQQSPRKPGQAEAARAARAQAEAAKAAQAAKDAAKAAAKAKEPESSFDRAAFQQRDAARANAAKAQAAAEAQAAAKVKKDAQAAKDKAEQARVVEAAAAVAEADAVKAKAATDLEERKHFVIDVEKLLQDMEDGATKTFQSIVDNLYINDI